jgi:hypothetical protein
MASQTHVMKSTATPSRRRLQTAQGERRCESLRHRRYQPKRRARSLHVISFARAIPAGRQRKLFALNLPRMNGRALLHAACTFWRWPDAWRRPTGSRLSLPVLLLAAGCAAQKPPPTVMPSCGALYRGQHVSNACIREAKQALDNPNTSELDHWRARAAIECPVNGVISTDNDQVSFQCFYDLQKVGELSPAPWWLLPFKPLIAGINWTLKGLFQLITPLVAG